MITSGLCVTCTSCYRDWTNATYFPNMYVQLKVQKDVLFYVTFILLCFSSTRFGCYLHPSSGTQLQRTSIGVCV
jgi:hypothetical protein